MARAIWKGSISFGLVNIPIALYPATRRDELKFRLLRKTDLSPVNYKRVAAALSSYIHNFRFVGILCLVCTPLVLLFAKVREPKAAMATH